MVCFGSYIRHIDRVVALLLVFLVNTAISDRVSVHYDVTPGAGLAGLKCVSENVQFRRAVRFNNTLNVCEMLDELSSTNVTFEPDYVYMQMLSYEEPFKENFTARSSFPSSFDVGCYFDVVFRTPASRPRWFSFKVVDWSSAVNTTFLHVHFRSSENIMALKSRYFGTWSDEITTYNPITEYNAVYRVTVFWHNTHWSAVLETSNFPPNFVVGCHFDVIFKTPDFQPEWFNFRVVDWSDEVNTTFIQVHFRPSASQTAFRSAYFGNWSQDILTPNPITEVNTVYTASVYLYETYWSVFVDGNHLINFTHLHQFNGQQMVHFWSLEVLCQHIVFYVP